MSVDAGTAAAVIGIINVLITVGGGFFFMGRLTGRLDSHEANTTRIEADVHEVKGLLVSSAVDGSRLTRAEADINNLESDFRNLRRGIGWINDSKAQSVDREY